MTTAGAERGEIAPRMPHADAHAENGPNEAAAHTHTHTHTHTQWGMIEGFLGNRTPLGDKSKLICKYEALKYINFNLPPSPGSTPADRVHGVPLVPGKPPLTSRFVDCTV